MRLISMTDFVLEIGKQTEVKTYAWYYLKVTRYAQFLKEHLTLDVFIGDKALFEGFYLDDDFIWFEHLFIYELDKLKFYCIEDMLSNTYLEDQDINLTPHAIKKFRL